MQGTSRRFILRASLLAFLLCTVASAGVVSFDTLNSGDVVTNQYAGLGVIFAGGFTVLNSSTAWGATTTIPGPPNYVQLTDLVSTVTFQNGPTPMVTGFVSFDNLGLSPNGGWFTGWIADALDLGGNVIASQTINRVDNPNSQSVFTTTLSAAGIHSLRFTLTVPYNGLAAFDTLTFSELAPGADPGVPEPSSLVLLMTGLVAIACGLRHKARC